MPLFCDRFSFLPSVQRVSSRLYNLPQPKSVEIEEYAKGQLISKCPFGVFKSAKKTTKFFKDFCPSLLKDVELKKNKGTYWGILF